MQSIQTAVLDGLTSKERVRAVLRSQAGLELTDFAKKHALYLSSVHAVLRGSMPGNRIRDLLAEEAGMDRSEIDLLIDGEPAATDAAGS